jgi:CO/xanthine dehydrogenase FAD-binding subunit
MKPPRFDYHAPHSLDEALALLARYGGDAKPLAGGQSLVPLLNFRLVRPTYVVDLNDIPGLDGIRVDGDRLAIGAMTRQRAAEMSAVVRERCPLLAEAMPQIGHVQIRNRGTIGGSLSHADPAAELPMMAMFYGASLTVQGPEGRRAIAAKDFFVDALTNCLEPEDIVVEIEFPILQHDGWAFEEVARRFGDFALASVAVSIRRGKSGIEDARVAVMGVADTPLRLDNVEQQLCEIEVDGCMPDRFSEWVTSSVTPNSDLHASGEYRKHLLCELAKRAMRTALMAKGESR